jgi:cytochrome c5
MTLAPDRVSKGRLVFEASCKKCHELYSPGTRNADSWISIMREMGPKANLSPDHYTMVSAYLVQNARK